MSFSETIIKEYRVPKPTKLPSEPNLCHIVEGLRGLAVPIDELIPDPANARLHPEANLTGIKASLRVYGQRKPVVVNKRNGVVEAGNGTLAAARSLGWSHIAAVFVDDDPSTAAGFAISDNRTSELAEWDTDALDKLLREIDTGDEDLQAMLSQLAEDEGVVDLSEPADIVEDEVPEPPVDPITKPGDLWILGEHRLLCGDSTKAEDVARVMGGEKASCVFTDPPYGVSVGAKNRMLNSFQKAGGNLTDIEDDDLTPEELEAVLLQAFVNCRTEVMADDCTLFVCSPQGCGLSMMMMMMQKAGLKARHVLIWMKNQPTFSMGRLDYDYQHEPILLTWLKRHKRPMNGTHKTSVWKVDKPRKSAEHPTMKPVELYANAYLNNSDDGDVVADLYGGSGTAIIAAEQVRRKARVVEISPAYCDVIITRWETLTGRKAVIAP